MIETSQLTKRYGDLIAVNHIDLKLKEGDVFGFHRPERVRQDDNDVDDVTRCCSRITARRTFAVNRSYTHYRKSVGWLVHADFFGVYDMTVVE